MDSCIQLRNVVTFGEIITTTVFWGNYAKKYHKIIQPCHRVSDSKIPFVTVLFQRHKKQNSYTIKAHLLCVLFPPTWVSHHQEQCIMNRKGHQCDCVHLTAPVIDVKHSGCFPCRESCSPRGPRFNKSAHNSFNTWGAWGLHAPPQSADITCSVFGEC